MNFWNKFLNHFFGVEYVGIRVQGEYSHSPKLDVAVRVRTLPTGTEYIRYKKRNYTFLDRETMIDSLGKETSFQPLTWSNSDA